MTITILGELYSSKNSRNTVRVGKRLIPLKSKRAKSQEADFHFQLLAQRKQFSEAMRGKEFPLRIQFKIYRRTHGRFDFLNITQGICDAMVRAQIIPDDDAKHLIPVFVPYEKDEKNPRTEITIL